MTIVVIILCGYSNQFSFVIYPPIALLYKPDTKSKIKNLLRYCHRLVNAITHIICYRFRRINLFLNLYYTHNGIRTSNGN